MSASHGDGGDYAVIVKSLFIIVSASEVAVARSAGIPTRAALLESWKGRKAGRAAPVLLVVLHPEGAALCGASFTRQCGHRHRVA